MFVKKRELTRVIRGPATLILIFGFLWQQLIYPSLDPHVHFIFCDIGQGDGLLIRYKRHEIIVDGGPDPSLMHHCLAEYLPLFSRELDALVATHADQDHIGGLAELLEHYQVLSVYTSSIGKKTVTFQEFRARVLEERTTGMQLHIPITGERIAFFNKIQALVLWPSRKSTEQNIFNSRLSEEQLQDIYAQQEENTESINNEAIALFLTIDRVRFLLMSDLEEPAELALLQQHLLSRVDVLKVAHHGSKTSSSSLFLEKVLPEIAVISSGRENHYGHPHREALERLKQVIKHLFRTDLTGTIELHTDGRSVMW